MTLLVGQQEGHLARKSSTTTIPKEFTSENRPILE